MSNINIKHDQLHLKGNPSLTNSFMYIVYLTCILTIVTNTLCFVIFLSALGTTNCQLKLVGGMVRSMKKENGPNAIGMMLALNNTIFLDEIFQRD